MLLIPQELEEEEDKEEEEDEEKEDEEEEEIEDDQPNNVDYHFVQNVAVRRPYSRSPSRSLSPTEDTRRARDRPRLPRISNGFGKTSSSCKKRKTGSSGRGDFCGGNGIRFGSRGTLQSHSELC
ncbi:hypothetical protein CRE_23186 [Caenorhabditis remanei]|uniref:Uncharacterized protein n=1 Tax=Caenorhabditis remanei TaxID=31234 RepID=E3NKH7_CAERE|nr:hypothetical protein CRE_23186 [Caenorhabditis remanei]